MNNINYNSINKKVSNLLERLSGDVSLIRLFTDDFVTKHSSKYTNINDLLSDAGVIDQASFEEWEKSSANDFIHENTDFSSWDEMLKCASSLFIDMKKQKLNDGTWEDETFSSEPNLQNVRVHIGFN